MCDIRLRILTVMGLRVVVPPLGGQHGLDLHALTVRTRAEAAVGYHDSLNQRSVVLGLCQGLGLACFPLGDRHSRGRLRN